VLIIGKAERFHCGKQVASYLGLVPLESGSHVDQHDSCGGRVNMPKL
jgi:hypothetical protein